MKTDEKVKKDVVSRLSSDSRIDANDINVTVKNGIVTLEGTVPTFSDEKTARDIAWFVNGAISIDNQLTVEFPATYTAPTDSEIMDSVQNLLRWNADVSEEEVTVAVSAGIVTLEGSVTSYWEKMQAERDASRANGVLNVVNQLAVVPTENVTDEIVGESIMDRIAQNAPLQVDDIDVEVEDGEVTLSGTVPTYNIWRSVYDSAQNTLGVTEVDDQVVISYS